MTYLLIYINGHPVCPDCFNDDFITDLFHAESYCSKCGLVVKDNTLLTIRSAEYIQDRQNLMDNMIKDYLKSHPDHD